jgi:hypothetical protein
VREEEENSTSEAYEFKQERGEIFALKRHNRN